MQGSTSSQASNSIKYYDSDDAFNYYNILYSEDYSGIGLYLGSEEVKDPVTGERLKIGKGVSVADAVLTRDKKTLSKILSHFKD